MTKTESVSRVVRDDGIAEDDSLAENDERIGLHPLDQFRAFQILHDGGMSEEDMAARHFATPSSNACGWRQSRRSCTRPWPKTA